MKKSKIFLPVFLAFTVVACGEKPDPKPNPDPKEPEIIEPEKLTPSLPLADDFDYSNFEATPEPFGVNVSYYSDIYSRGFAWFTDKTITETKLYLVESGKNYLADFSNAVEYTGTTIACNYTNNGKGFSCDDPSYETRSGTGNNLEVNSHKVHVENLKENTSYSYKIGSESGWKYGAFTTETKDPKAFTALQLSDAQTYHSEMLSTYRNTLDIGIKKAGDDLDFILYNGDQFDQNMAKVNNTTINNILRYTKAFDAIEDIKSTLPFMSSSGNHEPTCPYSQVLGSDINYGAFDYKGGNYSFDYGYAHFIVLNANRLADDDPSDEDYVKQMKFLTDDLASDSCKNAKWKIVMIHIGCYTTGDHSNESDNQRLVERLTPLFSSNHVDLVLQAHDHTYNKTLPYKWDAAGYTTTRNNPDVVNYSPETISIGNKDYDLNPNGTYYVTTGAAGHRAGSGGKDGNHEYEDGIWAEVKINSQGELEAAYSSKTYLNNKYKCEVGKLNVASTSTGYTTSKGITVSGEHNVGDPATNCLDGQMFGVLNVTEETLTYDSYLIGTGAKTANLFDSLNICKK